MLASAAATGRRCRGRALFDPLFDLAEEFELGTAAGLEVVVDKLVVAGIDNARALSEMIYPDPQKFLGLVGVPQLLGDSVFCENFSLYAAALKAKADLELGARLAVGSQSLDDSFAALRAASKRRRLEDVARREAPVIEGGIGLTRSDLKKACRWSRSGGVGSAAEKDLADLVKWRKRVFECLERAQVPSWLGADLSGDPEKAKRALVGGARPGTIRLRVSAWESYA